MGESQSALFLTTYINAIDPLARVYDGFLVHSRFGPAAPLDGGSIFEVLEDNSSQAVAFRPDLRVPLITIITETDLFDGRRLGYYSARQPDNQQLRVWEIAGAAHADNYTIQVAPIDSGSAGLADIVAAYAPTNMLMGQTAGPLHQLCAATPLRSAGGAVATARLGERGPARAQRHAHRDAAVGSPLSTNTASCAAVSERRGWTSRSLGHPASEATRARWRRSSAPVSRSMRRPCSGSTRTASGTICGASPCHSTRRFNRDFCWPPIATRSCELAAATFDANVRAARTQASG